MVIDIDLTVVEVIPIITNVSCFFFVFFPHLNFKVKLEFVFYVKTDVSPLSTCMSKICKQEL